jgi:hypothetical protein
MVANTLPAPKPAFKVAGNSPAKIRGRRSAPEDIGIPKNPWQKYKLKLLPKCINGKWYKPGAWVYRRWILSPGGGYWKYGDDFDYMRGR